MVPGVGAQVGHAVLSGIGQFQTDDLGRERHRLVQIGGAGPDVRDVGQFDHGA
jgi:hypothetical protein